MTTQHLYVTRAATLEYQRQCGGRFEAARRALTMRLLAVMSITDPDNGWYQWTVHPPPESEAPFEMRARVQREGPLLVVTHLERSNGAVRSAG